MTTHPAAQRTDHVPRRPAQHPPGHRPPDRATPAMHVTTHLATQRTGHAHAGRHSTPQATAPRPPAMHVTTCLAAQRTDHTHPVHVPRRPAQHPLGHRPPRRRQPSHTRNYRPGPPVHGPLPAPAGTAAPDHRPSCSRHPTHTRDHTPSHSRDHTPSHTRDRIPSHPVHGPLPAPAGTAAPDHRPSCSRHPTHTRDHTPSHSRDHTPSHTRDYSPSLS